MSERVSRPLSFVVVLIFAAVVLAAMGAITAPPASVRRWPSLT